MTEPLDPQPLDAEQIAETLAAQPGLLARLLAPLIGFDPAHYAADGLYWPYPDLECLCPRCPSCGGPNAFPYAPGLHPTGMCGNDDCEVFTWSPLVAPVENLARAKTVVAETDDAGRTTLRPEEP